MAATTSTTNSCSGFFSLRSNNDEPKVVRSSSSSHGSSAAAGCGKLDGVAMWFINGVATAFFASLQRCSCIRIATVEEDDGEEANDVPLIHSDGNYVRHDAGTISRRRKKNIS
ncbi:hypothetical protein HRI_002636600 [Hibiscus trionum]|uniref:Uncharacterized protein n=1 Tax=Hibiscus trionum TaxID=183268 RepID=A0A9W7M6D4_HIBTR|nr:hypothetical protein HRI_002636600 [Hibiscus trionum]